jgi:hypothetical protein
MFRQANIARSNIARRIQTRLDRLVHIHADLDSQKQASTSLDRRQTDERSPDRHRWTWTDRNTFIYGSGRERRSEGPRKIDIHVRIWTERETDTVGSRQTDKHIRSWTDGHTDKNLRTWTDRQT